MRPRPPSESEPDADGDLRLELASPDEAEAIARLRTETDAHLAASYHRKAGITTDRGVLADMKRGNQVFVARRGNELLATLTLGTRKPWAIDPQYFTPAHRPLYLTSMAVHPKAQRKGTGRWCLDEARRIAAAWPEGPADWIRLDAYDANYGAGEFYAKCGYREVGRVTYRKAPLIYYEIAV